MKNTQTDKARDALIQGRVTPRYDAWVFEIESLNGVIYTVTLVGDSRFCNCPFGKHMESPTQKDVCYHIISGEYLRTTEVPPNRRVLEERTDGRV